MQQKKMKDMVWIFLDLCGLVAFYGFLRSGLERKALKWLPSFWEQSFNGGRAPSFWSILWSLGAHAICSGLKNVQNESCQIKWI